MKDKNGAAIEGTTVKLLSTTKESVSDLLGNIDRAMADDYKMECSAGGFKTTIQLLHISRGKTSEVDWVLEEM
ncbi:MAG: hypothetical protein ABJA35_13225 [Parafilimonas sp.]